MKRSTLEIVSNLPLAGNVFELVLAGDAAPFVPGQFAEIAVPGKFLRRPFSVCHAEDGRLTLVCRAAGSGTEILSGMERGRTLDALTGLGNGFDPGRAGDAPLLVGGGTGCAALYGLCRELIRRGKAVTAALGFGTASDIFYAEKFAALGAAVRVFTMDGTAGEAGPVTRAAEDGKYSYFYACGPAAMLRALDGVSAGGEYSMEARMGCGFGACMGCTVQTAGGPRRVCRDGPVFRKGEIIWPTQP
jgi:dihydroorotate dehydrogenase electron transfer subunit